MESDEFLFLDASFSLLAVIYRTDWRRWCRLECEPAENFFDGQSSTCDSRLDQIAANLQV